MTKIYLDDERFPKTHGWIIIRNYKDFVKWINKYGVPDYISFDHDLGKGKDGYDAAKFLGQYCVNNNIPLPEYNVHSANIVGVNNIKNYLLNCKNKKL